MAHLMIKTGPNKKEGYAVDIFPNQFKDGRIVGHCLKQSGSLVIITDDKVRDLYALNLATSISVTGRSVSVYDFPHGDQNKTRKNKTILEDKMLSEGHGRDTTIIAIGGGVATDMAGFVAATYCRGVPVIYIPTSLLAMVDASVGGKTGVNTSAGKNLIGSFSHPKAVYMDPTLLDSLDDVDYYGGIIEALKHGLINTPDYFDYIVTNWSKVEARDPKFLAKIIETSCRIKQGVVEGDERESGARAMLNLGHTVAHALETASDYSIPHGPAVAFGLVAEAKMAVELDLLDSAVLVAIEVALIPYFGKFSIKLNNLDQGAVVDAMILDKKSRNKKAGFVFLEAIGKCHAPDGQFVSFPDEPIIRAGVNYIFSMDLG